MYSVRQGRDFPAKFFMFSIFISRTVVTYFVFLYSIILSLTLVISSALQLGRLFMYSSRREKERRLGLLITAKVVLLN